jgi:hypothetical protein
MVLHCIYRDKRSPRVENAEVDTENMKEDITRDYTNKTKSGSDKEIEIVVS